MSYNLHAYDQVRGLGGKVLLGGKKGVIVRLPLPCYHEGMIDGVGKNVGEALEDALWRKALVVRNEGGVP